MSQSFPTLIISLCRIRAIGQDFVKNARHAACDIPEQVRSDPAVRSEHEVVSYIRYSRGKERFMSLSWRISCCEMPQKALTSKGRKSLPKLGAANRHGKIIKQKKG